MKKRNKKSSPKVDMRKLQFKQEMKRRKMEMRKQRQLHRQAIAEKKLDLQIAKNSGSKTHKLIDTAGETAKFAMGTAVVEGTGQSNDSLSKWMSGITGGGSTPGGNQSGSTTNLNPGIGG